MLKLKPELGQVWTPDHIAQQMISQLEPYSTKTSIILDPCAGPGTFYKAAKSRQLPFSKFYSFELDPDLEVDLDSLSTDDKHIIKISDFLEIYSNLESIDIAILNPPYIRHELIDDKRKNYLQTILNKLNFNSTRRMNLYGYFLFASAAKLKPDGILSAIVYDSLESTSYGKQILNFLQTRGTIVSRTKISAPFLNTLVDAEIIVWHKQLSKNEEPLQLLIENGVPNGFLKISEVARIRRGTSFLRREYFVFTDKDEATNLVPLVTKQTLKDGLYVKPNTFALLESGSPNSDLESLTNLKNRHDDARLTQISRLPSPVRSPILFNYYIRNNPRHLWNPDLIAASDNFYCVDLFKQDHKEIFWYLANSIQVESELIKASRTQGSGLRKLQLFEYENVLFPDFTKFEPDILHNIRDVSVQSINRRIDLENLKIESSQLLRKLGYD